MCGRPLILLDSSRERGERIKVGLFLRGNFLMEQGKAFPCLLLVPGAGKLRMSFPRAEV